MGFLSKLFGKKDAPPAPAQAEEENTAPPLILPLLKPQAEQAALLKQIAALGPEAAKAAPIVHLLPWAEPDFSVYFGVDEGSHYHTITQQDVTRKDGGPIDTDEMLKMAARNLLTHLDGDIKIAPNQPGELVHMLHQSDGLEACLLLVDAAWDVFYRVAGSDRLMFAVLARDLFLFCDAEDVEAIGQLRGIVENAMTNGNIERPLSYRLFGRNRGEEIYAN